MKISASERLIFALDVNDFDEAKKWVDKLANYVKIFKVGSQLFTAEGPEVINMINHRGGKVFLDLKYHDIPNTVALAAEVATKLGVHIFNIHTSGGYKMMKVAAEAVKNTSQNFGIGKPLVLGVTLLTSIDQEILESELGIKKRLEEQVVNLAKLAKAAGLDGVVASSWEIAGIRAACGDDFIILTPGIRLMEKSLNNQDDQKRIMTPGKALKLGADFIVVGRPIRSAENPKEIVKKILEEMEVKLKDDN